MLQSQSGNFFAGETEANAFSGVPLADGNKPILSVSIENPFINEQNEVNKFDVLFGDSSRQRRRLSPGQSTDWIPVVSLDQVFVRIAPGTADNPVPADATLRVQYTLIRKGD